MSIRIPSKAFKRFMESTTIGYMEWHDGVPYALDALAEMSQEELSQIESFLIEERRVSDWRDVEALAQIGTPKAIDAIREAANGKCRTTRLAAAEYLLSKGLIEDISKQVVDVLRNGEFGDGLAEAQRLAAQYPTRPVRDALFEGALYGKEGRGVHFAALLYFLYGKTENEFDWNYRPFFLKFWTEEPEERLALFKKLCNDIDVDYTLYMR